MPCDRPSRSSTFASDCLSRKSAIRVTIRHEARLLRVTACHEKALCK
ncbi:MAG: hypothetical protein II305_04815 [Clostridia bacterium]|nr:hypothetical protein [Clostridia bacterium]